ncbi:hypothetical protein D3C85_856560 [compost metagenome]
MIYSRIDRYSMPFKKAENSRPVYTLITKPMFATRIFVIAEIAMKTSKYFLHLPGITNRNHFIGISMQYVHA